MKSRLRRILLRNTLSKATVPIVSQFTDIDMDEILEGLEGLEDLDDILDEQNVKNLDNAHNEITFIDYHKLDDKSGNNGNSPMGRFE